MRQDICIDGSLCVPSLNCFCTAYQMFHPFHFTRSCREFFKSRIDKEATGLNESASVKILDA